MFEPPDIAVEIVSPEQRVSGLVRRCLWYVANGVQVALLIDPDDQSVLTFRPGDRVHALRGSDRIGLGEVVPDLELAVDELWSALR